MVVKLLTRKAEMSRLRAFKKRLFAGADVVWLGTLKIEAT